MAKVCKEKKLAVASSSSGPSGSGTSSGSSRCVDFPLLLCVADQLMRSGRADDIFAHTYLLLTWNLACRASHTASILHSHLEWHEDSMVIQFSHKKNEQGTERRGHPRHVYANPTCPVVCPVLSLGVFFLGFPFVSDSSALFSSTSQDQRQCITNPIVFVVVCCNTSTGAAYLYCIQYSDLFIVRWCMYVYVCVCMCVFVWVCAVYMVYMGAECRWWGERCRDIICSGRRLLLPSTSRLLDSRAGSSSGNE